MRARVVVVDDQPMVIDLLRRQLGDLHEIAAAASAEEGLALVRDEPPDAVVTDLRMPGMDGLSLARRLVREHPGLPFVGMSGDARLPELTELLRLGMADFLVKPFGTAEARLAVARALALRAAGGEAIDGPEPEALAVIGGSGLLLSSLRAQAARAAVSSMPVLVEGPSGSGKTLLVRALHAASPRASEPLVEVACAALSESLIEGELFGHVAGAFTGAMRDRPGVFERARRGTIVLDEVSALSAAAQAKLHRAVSSHEVTRLGEDRPRPIEARIVATTQRALEPLVRRGDFRADLFHSLTTLRLRTPALAELPAADRLELARAVLGRTCARLGRKVPVLGDAFVAALAERSWPGNVRELQNVLERAVLLGDGSPLGAADAAELAPAATEARRIVLPERGLDLAATLAAIEEDHVRRALERTGGNRERAAALLGLARTALVQKLRRLKEQAT